VISSIERTLVDVPQPGEKFGVPVHGPAA